MLSAPMRTAPASSNRAISVASRAAGGRSRLIFEPASVRRPAMSNRFLTAKGTPASGPTGSPAARASSSARARAKARCSVTSVKELSSGSCSRMRARVASTTLTALARPFATAAAISAALFHMNFDAVVSSMEHRRRLGIVGQSEFVDQRSDAHDQLQIEFDAAVPRRLDLDPERLRARRDKAVDRVGGLCRDQRLALDRLLCTSRVALAASLRPHRLYFPRCLAFHDRGKNSSAKWQATWRAPKGRNAGIDTLQASTPRGQRPSQRQTFGSG